MEWPRRSINDNKGGYNRNSGAVYADLLLEHFLIIIVIIFFLPISYKALAHEIVSLPRGRRRTVILAAWLVTVWLQQEQLQY